MNIHWEHYLESELNEFLETGCLYSLDHFLSAVCNLSFDDRYNLLGDKLGIAKEKWEVRREAWRQSKAEYKLSKEEVDKLKSWLESLR